MNAWANLGIPASVLNQPRQGQTAYEVEMMRRNLLGRLVDLRG